MVERHTLVMDVTECDMITHLAKVIVDQRKPIVSLAPGAGVQVIIGKAKGAACGDDRYGTGSRIFSRPGFSSGLTGVDGVD